MDDSPQVERRKMKKILVTFFALLFVATLFVGCGGGGGDDKKPADDGKPPVTDQDKPVDEKIEVTGDRFEANKFSFVVPEGYQATESKEANTVTVIKKDMTDNITMMYQMSAGALGFETFLGSIIEIYGGDKVKKEEVTYGKYTYTKLEIDMGIKLYQFFYQNGKDVMTMTFPSLNEAAETILNTLEIK